MKLKVFSCLFLCLAACGHVKEKVIDNKKSDRIPGYDNTSPATSFKKNKQIINPPSPTFAKAHANAKILLNEPFYFNVTDEASPFGNPEGADSYLAFCDWRHTHADNHPKEFLSKHINDLGYPKFDIYETDFTKLLPYLQQHEFGNRLMSGTDETIIAIAFGQLYLEGTIDSEFKEIAKASIRRQLIPELLAMWGEPYKTERKAKLLKMLEVLKR